MSLKKHSNFCCVFGVGRIGHKGTFGVGQLRRGLVELCGLGSVGSFGDGSLWYDHLAFICFFLLNHFGVGCGGVCAWQIHLVR